jgi:regulator of replication initiation timing
MNKQEILDKIKKNDKMADKLNTKARKLLDSAKVLIEENAKLIEEYKNV